MPMEGKGRGSRTGQGEPQTEMQIKSWAIHWGNSRAEVSWEEFPLGRNVQSLVTPLLSVIGSKTDSS